MRKNNGKVFLIGAGPGDPGLITVKGKRLLESCDVVVYDALVNELLVTRLPQNIKRIFAGKRGGIPSPSQRSINELIVRETRGGKNVARLKGGDVLVFGRGSEEMEYLIARGIPYEVVPGITSAIAAPSYAGIPITHRGISRSFAVVTGHLHAGESIDSLELPQADTIVFLMAMANLSELVKKLLAAGKFTKKTPAALIRNGTRPDQETITGTLGTICALKEKNNITPPVAFIVGETVRFAKVLSWYRRLPLAGIRVAVLRTNEQSEELTDALTERGATVVPCPIIRIVPRKREIKRITLRFLRPFTMVLLTSPNGAGLFMESLMTNGGDARALAGKKVYALGTGTAAVLLKSGIRVDALPEHFVAEGVLELLPADLSGETILIPRASVAREVLPETLRKRGASVTVLPVYDTVKNDTGSYTFSDGDYVLFTSSSTVDYFYDDPIRRSLSIVPVCIGPITANTLRRYYRKKAAIADNATIPELIQALEMEVRRRKRSGSRR
ncbi:MAG: uroporphyrinogen-III C-methyltransferase [Chitinispirillaceae bacterium]|nr:uroporphyrinogen-III C-methyltransferase [Chitinispirillaceae bacterium]